MMKKILTMIAMLVFAAQFSIANADIPSPERFRSTIIPFDVSVESIDEQNNQVTIQIKRNYNVVENYSCKVYRAEDYTTLFDGNGHFDGRFALIGVTHKDLAKDAPTDLLVTVEVKLKDYAYKTSNRPILDNAAYKIEFLRDRTGKANATVTLIG